MRHIAAIGLSVVLLCGMVGTLRATTYLVGAGRTYATLQDVADALQPGDAVLVDGDATYPAGVYITQSGTSDNWITISGVRGTGGNLPEITGTGAYGINISADNVILQGFDVNGGPKGIGLFGDNIIVRGCVVHDCNHGLIGYGSGTGNVTVEYTEFYGNGVPTGGATQHQIYMATDEDAHPGSVFRLQYCYLHDAVEGDNVKSRSERNEIYYNWIELAGTSGHGLGLFAPDPDDNGAVSTGTAREDADVVGNVVIQDHNACARIGGDLPGHPTNGRYRFVNNTFILTGSRGDAIRTFNTIETLEMYNNVIYNTTSGSDIRVVNDADGAWVHSPRSIIGSNNWVSAGAGMVPGAGEWSSTTTGSSSPFAGVSSGDYRPEAGGALVNTGTATTPTISLYPFPGPLFPPAYHPPQATLIDTGTAESRPVDASIDMGAFEWTSSSTLMDRFGAGHQKIHHHQTAYWPEFGVYSPDGRLVRTLSRTGPGFRIVRFQSGAKTGTRRSVAMD